MSNEMGKNENENENIHVTDFHGIVLTTHNLSSHWKYVIN